MKASKAKSLLAKLGLEEPEKPRIETWNPSRKYIMGWSEGESPCFVYRNARGEKIIDRVKDYRHHFFVKTADWKAQITADVIDFHRKQGIYKDHEHLPGGEWTKIYACRYIKQTDYLKQRGETESAVGLSDEKIERFPRDLKYKQFYEHLHQIGIQTYEADLSPRMRWMTDQQLNFEDKFRVCYFDIETDDRVAGFERLWERRVLSIAWVWVGLDGEIEEGCAVLESDTNKAERAMFDQFLPIMKKSEIMYAWNGGRFDFKILPRRMSMSGISSDHAQLVAWQDLLKTYRSFFTRGATSPLSASFALGEVGSAIVGIPKMDWKDAIARVCNGCHAFKANTFYDLWRTHPEVLRDYNMWDAKLLYLMEKEKGFAKIDQAFNRITNCLVTESNVSAQIDALLLKKAAIAGTHFKTRKYFAGDLKYMTVEEREEQGLGKYIGAYVFEPVTGIHDDVAALDFKSLYPSMMVLFNLSIDTYVAPEDVKNHDPKDLITCPTGAKFLKNVEGFVPSVFKETLARRKEFTDLQAKEEIGSEKWNYYYSMSYSFKRLGLSFYGEMGNTESRYYNQNVAEAVTRSGQFFIKETKKLAEQNGYLPLYGDTDSIYIKATREQAEAFAKASGSYYKDLCRMSGFNVDLEKKWMVELEYENHFKTIFFVSKKRYAGLMTWYKGQTHEGYVEVKGLEYVRGDHARFARNMQFAAMTSILNDRPSATKLAAFVLRECKAALSGKLTPEQIIISQGLEKPVEEYKNQTPHIRLGKYIKENHPTDYWVGMKVQWVMLDSKTNKAKPQTTIVWAPEWDPTTDPYDAEWYWDHKLYPPTYRVLRTVYPSYPWEQFFVCGRAPKSVVDKKEGA